MEDAEQILHERHEPALMLREQIPGVFEGYRAIGAAALTDAALDAKTRELIALAIAVVATGQLCPAAGTVASGHVRSPVSS
jgi:alkylhydroperoxidase/carboxymuconolactone decarboxylase family protein YurZ